MVPRICEVPGKDEHLDADSESWRTEDRAVERDNGHILTVSCGIHVWCPGFVRRLGHIYSAGAALDFCQLTRVHVHTWESSTSVRLGNAGRMAVG